MSELQALRDLLAKATPGPWRTEEFGYVVRGDGVVLASIYGSHVLEGETVYHPAKSNAALIVSAVNALPALIECAEMLREIYQAPTFIEGIQERVEAVLSKLDQTP